MSYCVHVDFFSPVADPKELFGSRVPKLRHFSHILCSLHASARPLDPEFYSSFYCPWESVGASWAGSLAGDDIEGIVWSAPDLGPSHLQMLIHHTTTIALRCFEKQFYQESLWPFNLVELVIFITLESRNPSWQSFSSMFASWPYRYFF